MPYGHARRKRVKVAENLVADHYERDFDFIFLFMAAKTWLQSTMKYIFTRFSNLWWLKAWLQSTVKEILTWFSILRQLETWLQTTMKEILTWFSTLW